MVSENVSFVYFNPIQWTHILILYHTSIDFETKIESFKYSREWKQRFNLCEWCHRNFLRKNSNEWFDWIKSKWTQMICITVIAHWINDFFLWLIFARKQNNRQPYLLAQFIKCEMCVIWRIVWALTLESTYHFQSIEQFHITNLIHPMRNSLYILISEGNL